MRKTSSRRATWDRLAVPKVTVVIAAYNVARFIRQSVESALAQSLSNIEVIVIDDGSTDNTQSILQTFSDHRLVLLRQENSGVSAARNVGLALARSPYIFFLDADDILTRDALARMVATLEQMPERIACFGHHIKISEDGAELSTRSYLRWKMLPAGDTLRNLIAKNFISGAICVRTEAARAVGGFNAALALGEDWEFWCRLATLGDFVAMPDEIILLYRQRFSSASYKLRESPVAPELRSHRCDLCKSDHPAALFSRRIEAAAAAGGNRLVLGGSPQPIRSRPDARFPGLFGDRSAPLSRQHFAAAPRLSVLSRA